MTKKIGTMDIQIAKHAQGAMTDAGRSANSVVRRLKTIAKLNAMNGWLG